MCWQLEPIMLCLQNVPPIPTLTISSDYSSLSCLHSFSFFRVSWSSNGIWETVSFYGLLILFFLLMNHISFCGSIGLSNLGDFLFCSRTVSLCSQSYPYLQSSCLSLLSSEITSMCHHILFFFFLIRKETTIILKSQKQNSAVGLGGSYLESQHLGGWNRVKASLGYLARPCLDQSIWKAI